MIPIGDLQFTSKTPIEKGWSADRKYCVTDAAGTRYLLRISAAEQYARKESQYALLQRVAALGIPMCRPVAFGMGEDGVYTLQSWIDGEDAEVVLPRCTATQQYALGQQAGEILRQIHTIPAPADTEAWEVRFNRKIDRKLKMYAECELKYDNG